MTVYHHEVDAQADRVQVTTQAPPSLNISAIREYWSQWFNRGPWPVEDLYYGLIEQFLGKVVVEDPGAFEAVRGKSVLYLANHQVGAESLLFSIIASGLSKVPTVTLAKMEHKTTWLGQLIEHNFSYPGIKDPKVITFFDRDDRESLPKILGELAAEMVGPGRSVMVHIEGTRALECRTPVQKMSGAFIDMALKVGAPIVPVRFTGALPAAPLDKRIEFPVGMGRQDIWFGKPMMPNELAGMHYGARKNTVIDAINRLGPSNAEETPTAPNAAFAADVDRWMQARNVDHEHATLYQILRQCQSPCTQTQQVLDAIQDPSKSMDDSALGAWLQVLVKRLGAA